MEEAHIEFRRWDELIPETLGLIFSLLSLEELLTVVPCVCKSWRNAVIAPYFWQRIDITQWSNWRNRRRVDRMLRMLITRSNGSLRELCVPNLANDKLFSFITENAGSLEVLRIPGSRISNSIVKQTSQRLSNITLLDLSHCNRIGARALEAIGKHCKLLVTLRREMDFIDYSLPLIPLIDTSPDKEAKAIADTMIGLKRLEMSGHVIRTESALNILFSCPQLEFLKIGGCWDGVLEEAFLKEKFPKLEISGLYAYKWDDGDFDLAMKCMVESLSRLGGLFS